MSNLCKLQIPWNKLSQFHCSVPWTWLKRKALLLGSSIWLTFLPIKEFGFALHERVFQAALALHYNWQPLQVPSTLNMPCHAPRMASLPFDTMKLRTWQLIYSQKSAVMSASSLNFYLLMGRSWPTVSHTLRMVLNWTSLLWWFWGGWSEHNFFDVQLLNPHAPSNRHPRVTTGSSSWKEVSLFEQRVRGVEHASFIPLILLANEVTVFYKRLTSCLATKCDQPFSSIVLAGFDTDLLFLSSINNSVY